MIKRTKSRVDVYMHGLKTFSKKEIYDLDDQDVLEYLMFKDINESGRTDVHHHACPNEGNTSTRDFTDPAKSH